MHGTDKLKPETAERGGSESLTWPSPSAISFSGRFAWVSACHNFSWVCAPIALNDVFIWEKLFARPRLGYLVHVQKAVPHLTAQKKEKKEKNLRVDEKALSLLQLESFMTCPSRREKMHSPLIDVIWGRDGCHCPVWFSHWMVVVVRSNCYQLCCTTIWSESSIVSFFFVVPWICPRH